MDRRQRNVMRARAWVMAGSRADMQPPGPGFDRVTITCRDCDWQDVLDLQRGAMTVERLRHIWTRCASCGSRDIEIEAAGDVSGARGC